MKNRYLVFALIAIVVLAVLTIIVAGFISANKNKNTSTTAATVDTNQEESLQDSQPISEDLFK